MVGRSSCSAVQSPLMTAYQHGLPAKIMEKSSFEGFTLNYFIKALAVGHKLFQKNIRNDLETILGLKNHLLEFCIFKPDYSGQMREEYPNL